MTLQSKLTENIARDEMYSISKNMMTVNLSSLMGLQKSKKASAHHISFRCGCDLPVEEEKHKLAWRARSHQM